MVDSWIVVVDDDVLSLKNARNLLIEQNIRVTCVRSGRELLSFMQKNEPDLILLDVLMPEQDGFETYRKLRELEEEEGRGMTPVIFLTGDEDSETEQKGFEIGASDFIRKPFNRESLLWRIRNVVAKNKEIETLTEEATVDRLTGFFNKAASTEKMTEICMKESGMLAVIDLDNFKLINDIYGHDMGDKVLSSFADLVRDNTREEDVLCRIGGDEFLAFFCDLTEENEVSEFTRRLNVQLKEKSKELMGDDFNIDIGVSVGCVSVPGPEKDYDGLFQLADKALYYIKKNGKHNCSIYNSAFDEESGEEDDLHKELLRITQIMEERGETGGALWFNQDAFTWGYRFMIRFMKRCRGKVMKFLFSVSAIEGADEEILSDAIERFGLILQKNVRKSDIMMQDKKNHFFMMLPELSEADAEIVFDRVMGAWAEEEYHDRVRIESVRECLDFTEPDLDK